MKEDRATPLEEIKYKSICESIKAHQHALKLVQVCGIMNIFDFSLAFNVNFESVLSLFNIIQT